MEKFEKICPICGAKVIVEPCCGLDENSVEPVCAKCGGKDHYRICGKEDLKNMIKDLPLKGDTYSKIIMQIRYPVQQLETPSQKLTWCLISLDVPFAFPGRDADVTAVKPMITVDGIQRDFQINKKFKTKKEAVDYAKKHEIRVIE